jgi:hypothetical protein
VTLREEIAAIPLQWFRSVPYVPSAAVFEIIDRHEAENPLLCARCDREMKADNQARNEPEPEHVLHFNPEALAIIRRLDAEDKAKRDACKPSEDRPARALLDDIVPEDLRDDHALCSVRAIVESVDALTAAVRDSRQR